MYLIDTSITLIRRIGNVSTFTKAARLILIHRVVGLVVKASSSRAEDPGLESRLRRNVFQVES